jgi:hypothetical protein
MKLHLHHQIKKGGNEMTLNKYQTSALTDLIASKKIDILESLGHDAILGADSKSKVFYAVNLEIIEKQISQAIIDNDALILGVIMMKLFMDYNEDIINEKAQELQDEAKQEQDDLHGVIGESELTRKHREHGVNESDF